jgi:serine protease inhibitor
MRFDRSLIVLLAASLAGCSETAGPSRERGPVRAFTLQEEQVADATIGFGLKLFTEVAKGERDKANVMVSPVSVSVALGMVLNGADGSTFEAIRRTLGFGTLEESAINEAYRGLTEQLYARAVTSEFNLVNSVWHDRAFQARPAFTDALKTYFDADVTALDFRDASAAKTISAWAERETRGRIKDLVESLSPGEVMMLVNATYFKAQWRNRFDKSKTTSRTFTLASGSQVNVPMMRINNDFRTVQHQDVTAVEMLYADSAFSMVLLMPNGRSVEAMLAAATPQWWQNLLYGMRTSALDLVLPRFNFDYDENLVDALGTMGMGIAFGPSANLSRIAADQITRVLHKTFIETNEEGSEAAAATAIGIGIISGGPNITAFNRPFAFVIRERNSGAILFIGKVGDPSKN